MDAKEEDKAIKALVARGIRIPPQPKVLLELEKLLRKGKFDVRALAKVIAQDPGIVAMLFKAVRSPVYGGGKDLDTVDKVLMVIGMRQTVTLVQAMSIANALSDASRPAYEAFWGRSFEIARLASLIAADRVSVCNVFPEQAFLVGTFHECGVPILMQRFPDYCGTLTMEQACQSANLAEEDARFNVDHCVMGYLVAKHWKLPDFICSAIRFHHEMPAEEAGAVATVVAILQLARHFYHLMANIDHPSWGWLRDPVMNELGLAFESDSDYYEVIVERFHKHK